MCKNLDLVNIRGIVVMCDDGKLNLVLLRIKFFDCILDILFLVDMDYWIGGFNEKILYYRNKECFSFFCGCFMLYERLILILFLEC